jgi:WD40 repeat protein
VRALAFAPAGDTVWTIADDGRVRRWDLSPRVRAHVLEAGPAMSDGEVPHTLFVATFDPTARHAGAAVSDGTVFLWHLATDSSTRLRVEGEVTAMAVGPRGDRVAVTGDRFEVWSTGQTPARRIPFDGFDARAVAFSPDGRYLGAAASGEIRVFDLTRERAVRTVRFRGDAIGLAFSSNGTLLALADDSRRVSVWQWRNADARPVFVATERSAVGALAFGSRDRTLAYTVGGRVVVVWDLPNRRELARLSYENEVSALGFSPDGRHLGTTSSDRMARVLLWRPSDLITEAQSRLAPLR